MTGKGRGLLPALTHDQRVSLLALLAGLPGVVVALILLWGGDFTSKVQWTLTVLVVGGWWGFALAVRERVARPLQTLSNMLAALREGDFSIRARGAGTRDPLSLALLEANALEETLREQRLGALEATALLRKVMSEIDVAVFAFDGDNRLRLVNRAGERLLSTPEERLLGKEARELELHRCLAGPAPRTVAMTFPGASGRWEIRRSSFRQHGRPHRLLVLADLSRALREEELKAWQRLVRVLSHEINNSLAPIKSIAGSLSAILDREERPPDLDEDVRHGLSVIGGRAEALGRFMASYARLARLPQPELGPVEVESWVQRVVALETRLDVTVDPGPQVTLRADEDQLDQLLINLVRNGVDAALETEGEVRVTWSVNGENVVLSVEDDGPGIPDTTNLFVPFFTTKPQGTGIGLVLCRQIAEAHGGTVTLENRLDGAGCTATLTLPR